MIAKPIAEIIVEIAARERKLAVQEGEYVWAFICAVVEQHAMEAARSPA